MTDQLSRGTLFDPMLVTDLINKVKGHSSLAKLSNQQAIPFNAASLSSIELGSFVPSG